MPVIEEKHLHRKRYMDISIWKPSSGYIKLIASIYESMDVSGQFYHKTFVYSQYLEPTLTININTDPPTKTKL